MRPKRDHNRMLIGFARDMRHQATDAEKKMWKILRDRHLAGFKFRRQYPIAGYIIDFYCVRARLGIELDGGQHLDPEARRYDERRTDKIAAEGARILRFWDDDVLKHPEVVSDAIYDALTDEEPSPHPLPEYRERE
jgi:very-short-patch-repair endonuclease